MNVKVKLADPKISPRCNSRWPVHTDMLHWRRGCGPRDPQLKRHLNTLSRARDLSRHTHSTFNLYTFRDHKETAKMSEAYERERQNNSRLDELASKVSALRGVTIDIYDNARDQAVIDSTVCLFRFLSPPRFNILSLSRIPHLYSVLPTCLSSSIS